ncbi:hypothetical protein CHKEEEPN_1445 [Methylorubrum podarium]|nr:hypothetical protein CHKEEEPN_1445 [Methylorubrum podarium]
MGEPAADQPGDVLAGGAGAGRLRVRDVEAVERGRPPLAGRGGEEPAHGVGRRIAVQKVALGHVEGVDIGVRRRDAGGEIRVRPLRVAVGVGGGGEIGLPEIGLVPPGAVEGGLGRARAVAARRRAVDTGTGFAPAPGGGERVLLVLLLAGGDGAGGAVEQRQGLRKGVAERAGDAAGDVDARPVEEGQRQHLEAGDAGRGVVPDRADAHQREGMGHVLAAGAQRRRGPEVHDDAGRVLALVLQVAAHHRVGRLGAEQGRGAGGQAARIEGRQVAPRGHHVPAPARGRAGGARRDEAAVEGGDQGGALGLRAGADRLGGLRGGAAEHVQAVAERGLAEVAQMRVERGQRVGHRGVAVDARPREQPGGGRLVEDRLGDQPGPARIEHARGGILFHEFAQRRGLGRQPGGLDGGGEMAERDPAEPALQRRGLAGIVDDERIDHRQRPDGQRRPALA